MFQRFAASVGSLSLRARLSLGVIAVVLFATVGLATVALHLVKANMQASIANEQFERTSSLAAALDQKFVSRRLLLRTFSRSVELHQFADSQGLQSYLEAHRHGLKENFDNVAFLDLQGALVANLNGSQQIGRLNVSDRDYFKDTLIARSGVISQPFRNRLNGQAQIAVTQPVLDSSGAVRWVIMGAINLQEQNFLGELANVKFGKTGYMFITNTDGIVVDSPRKTRILNHSNAEGGKNPVTDRAIAGFEGTDEGMNRVGVYGLYAFKRLEQTNWLVGSIYPRAEAFVQIEQIERVAWIGAIVLTLLAGLLTYGVLHTQLEPLQRLHDHMQTARTMPRYEPMAQAPGPREIFEMSQTFDALMIERHAAQIALEAHEAYLRGVLTHAPDAFISMGMEGEITEWNRQAELTFGWSRSEVLGRNLGEVIIPAAARDAHNAGLTRFVQSGTGPVVDRRIEVDALHRDGHLIPIELSVAAVAREAGFAANAFLRDISERRAAQTQLAASEKRVRDITDHVPALIGYFDAQLQMKFANGPARSLFQIDPNRSYDLATALGQPTFLQHLPYVTQALAGQSVSFEAKSTLGNDRFYQAHMVPDLGENGVVRGMYIMTFDVSQLKRAEAKLLELSRIDALTGLPNRRRFQEKLEEALARAKRTGRALGVMFLDIDGFKQVNDAFGHGAGDEVLVEFARRLKQAVRETDTVARLSGDEFVVVLEGLHAVDEGALIAAKVIASMQLAMELKDHRLEIRTSIGVAVTDASEPSQETAFGRLQTFTAEQLLAEADKALYEAKRQGRNRFTVVQVG